MLHAPLLLFWSVVTAWCNVECLVCGGLQPTVEHSEGHLVLHAVVPGCFLLQVPSKEWVLRGRGVFDGPFTSCPCSGNVCHQQELLGRICPPTPATEPLRQTRTASAPASKVSRAHRAPHCERADPDRACCSPETLKPPAGLLQHQLGCVPKHVADEVPHF